MSNTHFGVQTVSDDELALAVGGATPESITALRRRERTSDPFVPTDRRGDEGAFARGLRALGLRGDRDR